MLMALGDGKAPALLGAAKAVGTGGGRNDLSEATADAISSFAHLGLGVDPPDIGTLREAGPSRLGASMKDADQCRDAMDVLAVMALVDGTLDAARIETVRDYAAKLDIDDGWLDDLENSLEANLEPVIADMNDHNLRSITDGRVDLAEVDDVDRWFRPYEDDQDAQLSERYADLETLPDGTFGKEFWSFYDGHDFAMPGTAGAVNETFATPHASAHVLAGYDTTPQGEMLVSAFTSRMHPVFPMSGHVLPVIYSWHLGIECNELAGSFTGALDPAKFWVALDRGRHTSGDTFGSEYSLWEHAEKPLDDVRNAFDVRPLDPAFAATSRGAEAGVDYRPTV
jgi:hypothetical protein